MPSPDAEAPAQTRAEARARAQAEARAQAGGHPGEQASSAGFTRPPARPPAAGELAYESTVTAPTEWVPYVYTTAEIQTHPARRGVSIAAVVCGAVGVLVGIFMIWGVPVSVAAVVLAVVARAVERRAGALWLLGLGLGITGILMGVLWFVVLTETVPAYYR